jgi:hypothetical protein
MTPVLPWIVLNTLQAGALLALAASFGADARRRRDRMMAWLSIGCFAVALRHGVLILQDTQMMPMELAERAQALLASIGLTGASAAFWRAFRPYFRFNLPLYLGIFLSANSIRCLLMPLGTPIELTLHVLLLLGYPFVYTMTLVAIRKAFVARDPISQRLMSGFLLALLPLLVEILVQIFYSVRVPLSGIAFMFMAISLGVSWFWVINHGFEQKVRSLEQEVAAWRSLAPGAAWSTEQPSPLMESLFGVDWTRHLQDWMTGSDGRRYYLHRAVLKDRGEVGWLETGNDLSPVHGHFLKGWRVALGMEESEESRRIRAWLEAWGADVEAWGTVPPREGPFPSFIVWGREPSIMNVWREYEMVRRRCRWVQVGGAIVEGPHTRLDSPISEGTLRKVLESLLEI